MQGHHDQELTWDGTRVCRICLPFRTYQQLDAKHGPLATNLLERLHEYVNQPEILAEGSVLQEQYSLG